MFHKMIARQKLKKQIELELEVFRKWILSKSREEIYDNCNLIIFYECVCEYFLYADDISDRYISVCLKNDKIIATLYQLYLEDEFLQYSKFEDVEAMIDAYVNRQSKKVS